MKNLEKTYGSTYQMDNVALSGTHTHAAPGGFNEYTMYDIPNLGFVKETHRALIAGILDVSYCSSSNHKQNKKNRKLIVRILMKNKFRLTEY